jgi:hypothetical protein
VKAPNTIATSSFSTSMLRPGWSAKTPPNRTRSLPGASKWAEAIRMQNPAAGASVGSAHAAIALS